MIECMEETAANERERLLQVARESATKAYAPYSRFRVGAAVLGARGIYAGANVENASWGLSLCAERSALAAAAGAGDREVLAIAVACIDAPEDGPKGSLMPCGACRQWMAELAPQATIYVAGVEGEFTVENLLPDAFRLSDAKCSS